jgi:antitoxin (DNA-binding transcriptional repressor) of toxin-antitoxin stability system
MKAITVSELKNHLSRYLRMAARGERIVVLDRRAPLAQLGPTEGEAVSSLERLRRTGLLVPGTQAFASIRFSKTRKRVDAQALLQAVRED